MSESASVSAGIASRYAAAIFELSKESDELESLESDVAALKAALAESGEFRAAIASPVYSREDLSNAIVELSKSMGLGEFVGNALSLMAMRRRLFVLPHLLDRINELLDEDKGLVTADVVSARALSEEQMNRLKDSLHAIAGKEVRIESVVDESLIGGLIVKLGSKMVDSSLKTKLLNIENAMKEVG
ncbi:MAG: F0F1 ATP synthase subunit delta [Albidovulum sp.]|nr:F0F1 ATP synthase subunit delta [Albidovulum sp.]